VGFGVFIVLTSLAGIALGLHAGEGWLAILYGGLGASMGSAGISTVWTTGATRGALLGWFLVGLASRALVEGDLYLIFLSVPIAAALLAALAFALQRQRTAAGTMGAAAGGGLAVLSLVALAAVAPSLPAICPPTRGPGILYPGNTPPFDFAEYRYIERCLTPNQSPTH
jgi:hypothetical protein